MLRRADFDSFDTVILLDIPLIGELEESRANLQEFSDTARRGSYVRLNDFSSPLL